MLIYADLCWSIEFVFASSGRQGRRGSMICSSPGWSSVSWHGAHRAIVASSSSTGRVEVKQCSNYFKRLSESLEVVWYYVIFCGEVGGMNQRVQLAILYAIEFCSYCLQHAQELGVGTLHILIISHYSHWKGCTNCGQNPKHRVSFQLGKAMQRLLSRMCKANKIAGNSEAILHSSSRFVDHWPMDQHGMTTCPRQTTSLGLVEAKWIQPTRLIRFKSVQYLARLSRRWSKIGSRVSTVKVAHRATPNQWYFFFPCPNWSPNKTDSSMVGPAKKSRFRFDNRAAWCNIKRIQRKLGQVFLQVMAVLCSIIIQLWKLCQFQVLSPGPMFNTPPNKKEQMHLSHLHIHNNYSIPREMFLFVPRGAKRLSRHFLCLVA